MRDEAGRERGYAAHRARWVSQTKLRYYHVLGVEPGVSLEELKEAHRDLVKVWHPDRFADDPRLQRKAQEKLKEINEAYEQTLPDALPALPDPVPDPQLRHPPAMPEPPFEAREAEAPEFDPPLEPERRGFGRLGISPQAIAAFALLGIAAVIVIAVAGSDNSRRATADSGRDEAVPLEDAPVDAPTFTLGSSQEEVLSVQGTPTSVEGGRWLYELSSVDFTGGKVESYANVSRNLHVRLEPASDVTAVRARGTFTLGSGPDEVLAVQGTPTSVEGRRWRFDSSSVDFANGKVESYYNASRNLRVRVNPMGDASAAHARGTFTLGSSRDDVLAVQGTPTSVEGSQWTYDASSVGFSDGRVDAYTNDTQNLRVQVAPKSDVSTARSRGFFTLGSTGDDVLAVQGTPTAIIGNRWGYELSWVKFDQGKVESYSNVSGNLRLRAR